MKTAQQQKLVYYLLAPLIAVIFASTWIASKYPEYLDYALAGMGVIVVALLVLAILPLEMQRTSAEATGAYRALVRKHGRGAEHKNVVAHKQTANHTF